VVIAERLGNAANIDHDFDRTPCRIIISERTLELLGDRYETEPVGLVDLKGKQRAVSAYRVMQKRGPV